MIIINTDKYREQIDKFYKKQLHRNHVIRVCSTSSAMVKLGAGSLDVIMKQSTLSKIIRQPDPSKSKSAHGIPKSLIHNIPRLIEEPALIVIDKERNSQVLLSEECDQNGNPILIAIKNNCVVNGIRANEIKSLYGKVSLKEYLNKQPDENVVIVDMNKAKKLSRMAGLQLPASWKVLDHVNSLRQGSENVKYLVEKNVRTRSDIAQNIKASGFQVTKSLIDNINKLDNLTGKTNTLKDICRTYMQGFRNTTADEKELILRIAEECKLQELEQNIFHGRI